MVKVGRDLWRWSGVNPLLRQGHVALGHVWMALEGLQRMRLQDLWATHSSVPAEQSTSFYLDGMSCVPVCSYCLLSCHQAPPKRAFLCPLCHLPCTFIKISPETPLGWTVPTLSSSPHRTCTPVSSANINLDLFWGTCLT